MNDLISRQDAIMHFVKASKNYECGMFNLAEVTHELWQIASAQPERGCDECIFKPFKQFQPERKKGKWLRTPTYWIYCSVCGCEPPDESNTETDYCPNCGADMRGESDD